MKIFSFLLGKRKSKFWLFIFIAAILIGLSSVYHIVVTMHGTSATSTVSPPIQLQDIDSAKVQVKLITKDNLNNWNIILMPDRDLKAIYTGAGKVTTTTLHMDGIKISGTGTGTPSPTIHVKGSGKLPVQNETVEIELEWIEDGSQMNGKITYQIIAR